MVSQRVRFERFLYDPDHCEGAWRAKHPGRIFGDLSILTAAMVRHGLDPGSYPLFIALGRALAAMRKNQEIGGGKLERFSADPAYSDIGAALQPVDGTEPAAIFCSAYPRYTSDFAYGVSLSPGGGHGHKVKSDLLRDLTGEGPEYVAAKAIEVVLYGPAKALRSAPKAHYGAYLTADRDEIERINTIHNLILTYRDHREDTRPLSIGVFGPPGSGKSFAIKALLSTVFPGEKPLEFNLSQFRGGKEDLYEALHQVRDVLVKGKIPLVFWDEFDVDGLMWLKEFLAPMQDGQFVANGIAHPLGRAVFVFAGGTCSSFEEFDRSNRPDKDAEGMRFREQKGPDFVSRLQGYVNIKGPQPKRFEAWKDEQGMGCVPEESFDDLARKDVAYLIRRAMLLRVALQEHGPHLIDAKTGKAAVGTDVVHAFLRAREYYHGARSLNSIVRMSNLAHQRHFRAACLPTGNLLKLRVTEDFLNHLSEGRLEASIIELLAKGCHEAWMALRLKEGWKYGKQRNDKERLHPRLLPYEQLKEEWKEDNRKTARLTHAKLNDVGIRIVPRPASGRVQPQDRLFTRAVRNKLMRIEHDIWLRDHLLNGYDWAKTTNESVRLHRDIATFDAVPREDQELDHAIVASIPDVLRENDYILVRTGRPVQRTPAGRRATGRPNIKKRVLRKLTTKKTAARRSRRR